MSKEQLLKQDILEKVKEYYELVHKNKEFILGKSKVNYAGRIYDEKEMTAMINSVLDFWLTFGKEGLRFEEQFSEYLGVKHTVLVNSGSSANLIAITALKSPLLENRLNDGDEVITTALTFPTTLAPIIQNNLIPVFVDVEMGTYNIDVARLEDALSNRTRAIFIPHTLGNPCDMDKIVDFARGNNLYLIEDACDALGAEYDDKKVGTFGDIATFSFYPAHHITMGEGGAVITNNSKLYRAVVSLSNWGRDCWCPPGESDTCKKRFNWQLGALPKGYDHKYIYSHIGYNLKAIEPQAAMGLEQLKKLPKFIEKRRENFNKLYQGLLKYSDYLLLPRKYEESVPSWFCFVITVKEKSGFTRNDMVRWLEDNKIETRMIFAGNILKHPGYRYIKHRIVGSLKNTDYIMENSFFIGVYPGLNNEMINYMLCSIDEFFERLSSPNGRIP